MRYTAKLSQDVSGYTADCLEIEATGLGKTRDSAIESLRAELADHLGHVEAMAPPSRAEPVTIEIVVVDEESPREIESSSLGSS